VYNRGKEIIDMKSLVVYFSRADENYNVGKVEVGNTELLAHEIAAKTGADEFKIEPVKAYPENYMECVELATREKESGARPEYVGDVADFSQYDTVFLGYPIWWGDLPMVVYSFIEKHDFGGKTVIPFATSGGSSIKKSCEDLKATYPKLTWKEGKLLNSPSSNELKNWVQSNK
jgi:flavodoxin